MDHQFPNSKLRPHPLAHLAPLVAVALVWAEFVMVLLLAFPMGLKGLYASLLAAIGIALEKVKTQEKRTLTLITNLNN